MAENVTVEVVLAHVILLTAARRAARSWLEPGRPGHEQAMEVLVRALIAFDEQGEDGSG